MVSAHKHVYEEKVRGPMLALVAALDDAIGEFAPEMVTEPKKAVYRIYRDVRFSTDKSPYKTHIAAVFSPRGLEKHSGAGLYFHISVDEVLVGGGIYAPGPAELLALRGYLANHAKELDKILRQREFRRLFKEMTGEKLKRVPKGFPQDHPAADLLVYKQFLAGTLLPPDIVTAPDAVSGTGEAFRRNHAVVAVFEYASEIGPGGEGAPRGGVGAIRVSSGKKAVVRTRRMEQLPATASYARGPVGGLGGFSPILRVPIRSRVEEMPSCSRNLRYSPTSSWGRRGSQKVAVPTWTATAPQTRNSATSSPPATPPSPITGILTAWLAW